MTLDHHVLDLPELRKLRVKRNARNDRDDYDNSNHHKSNGDRQRQQQQQQHNQQRNRDLGGSNDDYTSLLVDSNGNEYEPYSLAWRYLGLYMNCDVDTSYGWDDYDDAGVNRDLGGREPRDTNQHRERDLSSNDGNGEECERQLLWAAYVDPRYKGNGIEEYQFYDLDSREWDDSACLASGKKHRCVRMDCHEPNTHFKLVGVLKETEGMYDFNEQLFKHEGYCIWNDKNNDNGSGSGSGDNGNEDTYETMETWMENWPTQCQQLNNPDYYGNTIYLNVHPLPEGNMTLGIYMDNKCTTVSPYMDLTDYIIELYKSYYYYYGEDRGTEVAEMYEEAIATWNEKMSIFKVCQPCRAYNLFSEQSNNKRRRHSRRRFLEDENDGEGEEQERYNCYDDAGYTNVNQCYKFETHTSLESADSDDLAMASTQGSILRIKALDGKVYGKGGYTSPMAESELYVRVGVGVALAVVMAVLVFAIQRYVDRRKRRASRELKENLTRKKTWWKLGGACADGDGDDDRDYVADARAADPSLEMTSVYGSSTKSSGADYSTTDDSDAEPSGREKKSIEKVFESLSAIQTRLAKKGIVLKYSCSPSDDDEGGAPRDGGDVVADVPVVVSDTAYCPPTESPGVEVEAIDTKGSIVTKIANPLRNATADPTLRPKEGESQTESAGDTFKTAGIHKVNKGNLC